MTVESALAQGRAAAEQLRMTDRCRVGRLGGGEVFDPATGAYTAAALTTVYEGRCYVQSPSREPREADAAGVEVAVQAPVVSLPVSAPAVARGDTVTITAAAANPALVGVVYRVTAVEAKSHPTARRLIVERAS